MKLLSIVQIIYLLLVILFGAYVRMTGSGAGCGQNWPLCNGEFIPQDPAIHTMIEYTHRMSSGLCLPYAFLLLGLFWRRRSRASMQLALVWQSLTFFFLLLEGALGAGLVLLEHVAQNQSAYRAITMGLHLVNTFALMATAFGVVICHVPCLQRDRQKWVPMEWTVVFAGVVLLLFSGVSGAVTALGDTVFPPSSAFEAMTLAMQAASHLFVKLRVFHPFIAVFVGFALIYIAAWLLERNWASVSQYRLILGLVVMQWMVGILNVSFHAPDYLQLLHLAIAQLLWLSYVSIPLGVGYARIARSDWRRPPAQFVGQRT
ncbi:MAG: COX15/CtaA family protein [Zetaproteobacteria bacterium]|nr:COX15/CtaA family protein [Zetaproteobacteria bacterium]